MSAAARREPRRLRRARRAAAFHTERQQRATTQLAQFRAATDALVSAIRHTSSASTARALRHDVTGHVHQALDRAEVGDASRALYEQKLASAGTEVQRLGVALMCLQGVINRLPTTERDRLFKHYTAYFQAETGQIESHGGAR